MGILISILTGFGAALCAPVVVRYLRSSAGYWIALAPAGLFVFFTASSAGLLKGRIAISYPWVPSLGVTLSLYADGLSMLFAVLISGIGFLVTIYSAAYLKGQAQLGRYYGWLMTFTAAMLGLVLADNLLLMYVFWELTSISSFMLIGFKHEEESSRWAALQSLLVTGMGGLALLAGAVLLGLAGGTLEISALLNRGEQLQASALFIPAVILILLGAFTKSAQFPFHFWLPNAMVAPTPVSAYLHSAAMVKAGIYLLARLSPALGGNEFWVYATSAVGLATLLLGGYMAFSQTDLKLLLAYSTVSALGLLTLLIGLGTTHALQAAVVFLLAHALYKGSLFLVAGAIDHGTGTRNARKLGGLFRAMPGTAVAASVTALSMAGVLPLFGAIAKEMAYAAGMEAGNWIGAAAFFGGVSFVFVAAVSGFKPFWSRPAGRHDAGAVHEAPPAMWLSPALLAIISLVMGLWPKTLAGPFVVPAAAAVTGAADLSLAPWHGFKPAFFLGLASVVTGALLFLVRDRVRRAAGSIALRWGPERLYEISFQWMNAVALAQTRILQAGYLRHYLAVIVLTMCGLVGIPLLNRSVSRWPHDSLEVQFSDFLLAALIGLAAFLAVRSRSILGAVAAMGAAGYGVAAIYMIFGAPDLAMTQFLIESLTVVLFVLVFYSFPSFETLSPLRSRLFDAAVALTGGGLITLLVLLAASIQLHHPISDYFLRSSVPEAHGRNVVNVILVDFRALDTLGETTVLGIAAIGVHALIKFRKTGT